jgi:hypothetical protein
MLLASVSKFCARLLGLLREVVPAATLIAVLLNPTWPTFDTQLNDVQEAAQRDRAEAGGRGAGLPAGTRRDRAAGRIVNMEPERATKGPIIPRKRFGS